MSALPKPVYWDGGDDDPFDPRNWDNHSDMPYVPLWLSNDRDIFCIVDRQDYEWARNWLWFATNSGLTKRYAARSVKAGGKHTLIWLHKEILRRLGPPPSPAHTVGDHMNGHSLDNRRSNLRWATITENNRNKYGFIVKQPDLFDWRPAA